MPKINVYAPGDHGEQDRRVEIGWWPNGGVQVGTTHRQPVKLTSAPSEAVMTATGARATPDADGWTWDGQFTDLDRHGINQLIRALREARDKAYGRDE